MILLRIAPDAIRPTMWRIILADGRTSAMASLTRIKDIAVRMTARDPRRLHWKQDARERPREARRRVRPATPSSSYLARPANHKVGLKPGRDRAWRRVAGPEVSEVNLRIPLDPELAARQERTRVAVEEHKRKTRLAAARKAMRITPMLDDDRVPAVLHPSAPIPADDPFEIPAFLDRCHFVELEEAA
jgi:hypothetical protein